MKKHTNILLLAASILIGVEAIAAYNTHSTSCISMTEEDVPQWRHSISHEIYNAISRLDARRLATNLNSNIEISMPQGNSGVYSRKQAEVILHEFFSTMKDAEYTIDHERPTGNALQTISTLRTGNTRYRIVILSQDKGTLIRQIRIEIADE